MLALSLGTFGCAGEVADEGGAAPSGGAPRGLPSPTNPLADPTKVTTNPLDPTKPVIPAPAAAFDLGTTKLRRLTRLEYNNTVRDLLGDSTRPGSSFASDLEGEGGFVTGGIVSQVEADQYLEAGDRLATAAVRDLDKLLPCKPVGVEDACAADFVAKVGRRAYRRPLYADETKDLKDLYDWAKTNKFDFATRIQMILTTMLQSPNFLYRWEFGTPMAGKPRLNVLTSHELASRLSYALWSSMPDDDLFKAADAGLLVKPAEIEAQAVRMLASPKARDSLSRFRSGWLHFIDGADVPKDLKKFKSWSPQMLAALDAENEEFVVRTMMAGADGFSALFTADYSFGGEAAAKFYGVVGVAGTMPQKIAFPPEQDRAGVLTHASFLARNSGPSAPSPVRRGHTVREQFLCDPPPPPPKDLNPVPPTEGMKTIRQQVLEHQKDPACFGCHQMMDGFGLALEGFDAVGLVRSMDGAQPVNPSGEVLWPGKTTPVSFRGARELGNALAVDTSAQRCFVQQFFRFTMGRQDTDDGFTIDATLDGFKKAKLDIRQLMVALVRSEAFRYRKTLEGEVQP